MEILKGGISVLLGVLGGYFMWRGKKTMNVQMIVWGGVMIVLSYFLFSGGSDDQTAKNVLKDLMPGGTPPTQP